MGKSSIAFQKCINPDCGADFDCSEVLFKCPACGELLDTRYDWDKIEVPDKLGDFAARWANRNDRLDFSGVWRFRELLNFCDDKGLKVVRFFCPEGDRTCLVEIKLEDRDDPVYSIQISDSTDTTMLNGIF